MAGERVVVSMPGGGPYGFRVYGGDDDPLLIAKVEADSNDEPGSDSEELRKRSKASVAGLQEGDIILAINGYICTGMSHSVAMGLVDTADPTLTLNVLRGFSDRNAVEAAFLEASSQFKAAPSHLPGLGGKASSPMLGGSPRLSPNPAAFQQAGSPSFVNGHVDTKVTNQTFQQGNTQKNVTTETRTEKFGGTTVTKTTRQETTHSYGIPQAKKPMFQVSNFSSSNMTARAPKPWKSVEAPTGVSVQHNPDQSITMSFDDSKENQPPPGVPLFRVAKFTEGNKDVWQPGNVPAAPPKPRSQPAPQPPPPPPAPVQQAPPPARLPMMYPAMYDTSDAAEQLTLDISKYMASEYDDEEDIYQHDNPTRRTKKIFADSSFYDDPEHKYPTIEEQIKMAKRVANSLIAPANKSARGHTMFMKRKNKADKWTIDEPRDYDDYEEGSDIEDRYYNPNPWKTAGTHTWKPPVQAPSSLAQPKPMMNIPPPPAPKWETYGGGEPAHSMWRAPTLPSGPTADQNTAALSAEEFERLRLYEQKNLHNTVAPQVCFSLADDLRNLKGRGGKLFAKRKERSEKWVVDEQNTSSSPNPELMRKIAGIPPPPQPVPQVQSQDVPDLPLATSGKPRLEAMIQMKKPSCSPWEAAATDGTVERAFQHITNFEQAKKNAELSMNLNYMNMPGQFEDPLKKMGSLSTASRPKTMTPTGGAKLTGGSPGNTAGSGAATYSPVPPSGSQPSGGYRPIGFKAPIGGQKVGVGPASPWQPPASSGEQFAAAASEGEGYCDL